MNFGAVTFHEDLGDLGVAGTEGAVDLEAVGVVQERAAQGEQHFLWRGERKGSAVRTLAL